MNLKEVAFTVYAVRDAKKSRDFYTSTLGLKETANWSDKWIEFDVGPGTFAITDSFTQLTPGAKGAMVGLEVENLDSAILELEKKGVKLTMPKYDIPVCCGCTISDPDGNEIMLHQRKSATA